MTAAVAQARVAKGAAHLDRVTPGWWRLINADRLDLHSSCNCIVGQICGDFNEHFTRIGLQHPMQGVALGFNLNGDEGWHGYALEYAPRELAWRRLKDAWLDAIAARAAAESATTPEEVLVCA